MQGGGAGADSVPAKVAAWRPRHAQGSAGASSVSAMMEAGRSTGAKKIAPPPAPTVHPPHAARLDDAVHVFIACVWLLHCYAADDDWSSSGWRAWQTAGTTAAWRAIVDACCCRCLKGVCTFLHTV